MVNHNILPSKLSLNDVRGVSHSWFESYVQNHRQYVKTEFTNFGNEKLFREPQGSTLGQLLVFLLDVSDLANCTDKLSVQSFPG